MSTVKLSQLVAIEKGVRSKADRALTEAYHSVQKADPLSGLTRTYAPINDDDVALPSETKLVQLKTEQIIAEVSGELTRLFDVTLTKDAGNCVAKGNVVVDGNTVLADVPVTYLLFLEKQLVNLATFISKLPVLDPAETWEYDAVSSAYRSHPSSTIRNKKIRRNHVVAQATQQHPEQVQVYEEDVPVGTWTITKFSGGLPSDKIAEYARRVDALLVAVKFAREEANSTSVEDQKAGNAVLSYVFG